jgi:hypothetical protein
MLGSLSFLYYDGESYTIIVEETLITASHIYTLRLGIYTGEEG